MAEQRFVLKVIGDVFVSGPVDLITFATTKDESLLYTPDEAENLRRELLVKQKINTVKVAV